MAPRLVFKVVSLALACLLAGCGVVGSTFNIAPSSRFDEPLPLSFGPALPLRDDSCVRPVFLERIVERFNWVQRQTWGGDIRMVAIHEPREVDFKLHGPQTMVDKVYCRARAELLYTATNEKKVHHLAYVIAEDAGFVGVVPEVDFCVSGLDWTRFRLHEPSCRVLNPH